MEVQKHFLLSNQHVFIYAYYELVIHWVFFFPPEATRKFRKQIYATHRN